jgi:hypothetical protein
MNVPASGKSSHERVARLLPVRWKISVELHATQSRCRLFYDNFLVDKAVKVFASAYLWDGAT